MNSQLFLFLSLFTDSKSGKRFFVGVILGLSFSIAVILSTIGIMDGFERSLRQGLKKASGDLTINSRTGFFHFSKEMESTLTEVHIEKFSALVQTESFLVYKNNSQGVLIRAINDSYKELVGLDLLLNRHEAAIGSEIAKAYKINVGENIVLSFGKGNGELKSLPSLHSFRVAKIIEHGIYQKDSRIVYLKLSDVQEILELDEKVNMISLKIDPLEYLDKDEELVYKSKIDSLNKNLSEDFYVRAYWRDFSSILSAVKVEKVMISIILQTVVVVSIFNVLAFIIFTSESKSREIFLFKALGMSQKMIVRMWFKLIVFIWATACFCSIFLVQIFKIILQKISLFKLPAEIYYMPRLDLYISTKDYLLVFLLAFIWISLMTFILLLKIQKKPLLAGLRQEFA